MTNSVNRAVLVGRVVTFPETQFLAGGKVLVFVLMTEERLSSGTLHNEFHNIEFPLPLKDAVQIVSGELYYIEGKITTVKNIDDDGLLVYRTAIQGTRIQLLRPR